MKIIDSLITDLVEEGIKMGKTPWCACMYHEKTAYEILNIRTLHPHPYPQATMEETLNWRKKIKREK